MELTFDEIPEDLWEDWVWLVSPGGLMKAVEEETQTLLSSPYQVTSVYTVNLPKLVLFDLMWSSRLEMDEEGVNDANDLCRPVHRDADDVLGSLGFLLRNYPLVLRWKLPPEKVAELSPNLWDDIVEPPELLWYVPQELEGKELDLDSLSFDFFNPFIPSLRRLGVHRSVIGVVSAVRSLDQVSSALIEVEDNSLREAVDSAIVELSTRGLVELAEGKLRRITERGARMAQTEPLNDCLSCRCRVEEVLEYEMGGDED
ncbi:MAG: hypothetical protein NT131_02635 [Methanomassiliicoccales archaeon]|nr:hypothetical protein [Methanomassiliicoccales archaeon]